MAEEQEQELKQEQTQPRVQLIDVFCYNGEPIVELRLALLADVVDVFYVVESRVTFSGVTKNELFKDINANIFAPYVDKIRFIVLEESDFQHAHGNAWRREEAQRNAPLQRIRDDIAGDFILIVNDVDEIPRTDILMKLPALFDQLNKAIGLSMQFFYYNFGWIKQFPWTHSYVISNKGLDSLSLVRQPNLDTIRLSPKLGYIANAGWHCSYFETIGNIVRKIESFSHQEHNTEGIKTPAYIAHCMDNGVDLFARGPTEDMVPYDWTQLPDALREFHLKIKEAQTPPI